MWLQNSCSVTFEAHHHRVVGLEFSPDGQRLVSAGWDRKIQLWDVPNLKHIKILKHDPKAFVLSIAFQPNGNQLAVAMSAGRTRLELWDVEAGKMVDAAPKFDDRYLSFHPNGQWLASSSSSAVRIWDVPTWKVIKTIDYQDRLLSMAFSRDGRFLAAGRNVWEVSSGRLQFQSDPNKGQVVSFVDFHPNGRLLASAGHLTALWSVPDGRLIAQIGDRLQAGPLHFTPDGTRLVTSSRIDGTLKIWEIKKPRTPRLVNQYHFGGPNSAP